ncbi:MAG TPA: hypothetical protein VKQ36_12440 [Ktedonobacterales bacterium]|nr:hypothetical protein [Ktedonobacterales bacterium]
MDSLDHLAFDAFQQFGQGEQKSKKDDERALHLRAALMYELLQAEAQLRSDPDGAALRLDGALRRIAEGWFVARGLLCPPEHELLPRLDAIAPAVSGRLRLALHAPNAPARLIHCRALLRAALADDAGDADPHTTAPVSIQAGVTLVG